MRLDGKVAIITGASKGLGKAMALSLAGAGAKVALVSRNAGQLNAVAKQIEAAIKTVQQRLGRVPGEDEIAAELKVSLEEYQQWLFEVRGLTIGSLEFASDDQEGSRLNFIPDSEENLPSTTLERAELERLLAQAIEQMPKMERTVLSLYYHEEATLREIAEIMQMHLSRIAQLKAQGILRLRIYMERRWSAQR